MNSSETNKQIRYANSFRDLVSIPFHGEMNAACWKRVLTGDFSEIVNKLRVNENITAIEPEDLLALDLSEQGQLARDIILNDLHLLKEHGAAPALNVITHYDKDDFFFPTDVYSFHVDRSPIPVDTFLCTYHGEPSEILPNLQARQKILIPEIRAELKKMYQGTDHGFESFLSEHFFDLHYQTLPGAQPINLGTRHLWRLATDHPGNASLPCIHRAPEEKDGQKRLLLIC